MARLVLVGVMFPDFMGEAGLDCLLFFVIDHLTQGKWRRDYTQAKEAGGRDKRIVCSTGHGGRLTGIAKRSDCITVPDFGPRLFNPVTLL